MALNVVALLLVLAIIFMHSIFGFFSGLINVFCSITSVAIALGFYEALNGYITGSFGLHPGYTEPVCLVALFLVSMIVLRTLADNYIRGNVRVPMALDWGGAAVCGFINAQLFVGMLVIGVLMLPLRNPEKGTVIQFAHFQRNPDEQDYDHPEFAYFERKHLWTRSDEFTVGLFNLISGGSMRGKTAFASVYPDFSEAIYFSTNTVQPQSMPSPYRDKKNGDGFKKGLQVEEWWEQTGRIEGRYCQGVPTARNPRLDYTRATFETAPGKKLIAARLVLHRSAADRERTQLVHLFRPTMLRLVGTRADTSEPRHHVPRIIANADPRIGGKHRIVDYDNNFSVRAAGNVRIYAYFEVDEDFEPAFVEYRRHARASMDAGKKLEGPAEVQLTLRTDTGRSRRGRGTGRRTFGSVLEPQSGDNPRLPFAMMRRALQGAGDIKLAGDKFASGRIFGSRSRLEHSGEAPKVEEFKVPKGYRLLQVRYKPKQARTIVGQVFNYVAQLNQYFVIAANGDSHSLAGYYAIVKRSRDEYIELFFNGDPDDPFDPGYKHMLDFKNVERSEVNDRDDTIIGLLFLVSPDTQFKRIENQAGDGGDVNLRSRRG